MYCTILCTKEEDCIGTKAEEGSCHLYKDAIGGLEFHETSKTSSGIWLRWAYVDKQREEYSLVAVKLFL